MKTVTVNLVEDFKEIEAQKKRLQNTLDEYGAKIRKIFYDPSPTLTRDQKQAAIIGILTCMVPIKQAIHKLNGAEVASSQIIEELMKKYGTPVVTVEVPDKTR